MMSGTITFVGGIDLVNTINEIDWENTK